MDATSFAPTHLAHRPLLRNVTLSKVRVTDPVYCRQCAIFIDRESYQPGYAVCGRGLNFSRERLRCQMLFPPPAEATKQVMALPFQEKQTLSAESCTEKNARLKTNRKKRKKEKKCGFSPVSPPLMRPHVECPAALIAMREGGYTVCIPVSESISRLDLLLDASDELLDLRRRVFLVFHTARRSKTPLHQHHLSNERH